MTSEQTVFSNQASKILSIHDYSQTCQNSWIFTSLHRHYHGSYPSLQDLIHTHLNKDHEEPFIVNPFCNQSYHFLLSHKFLYPLRLPRIYLKPQCHDESLCIPFCGFYHLLSLIASHTWKNNAVFQISQSFASSGNSCDCWVFHHSPMGNFIEYSHPTAIPIIHFTNVPKYTITFKKEPSDDLPGSDTEFPSHPTLTTLLLFFL